MLMYNDKYFLTNTAAEKYLPQKKDDHKFCPVLYAFNALAS